MEYDFVITLRRPNYRAIDFISQILLLLFIASFIWVATAYHWMGKWPLLALLPALIIGLWVFNLTKPKGSIVYYRLPLLMSALGWIAVSNGWSWFTLVYALMGLLEPQIKFPDEIGFTKDKIVRSTFPRKVYQWLDVDNVMIQNNLFTLDLRNNKIVQKELETPVSKSLQDEFNTFCQKQLHFTTEA
jgi:hypothetical protein